MSWCKGEGSGVKGKRKFPLPFTLCLLPVFLLFSCGFQLRGDPEVGIRTISVTQVGASQVAAEIRRTVSAGKTKLMAVPGEAEAQLRILGETREKTVFTLTGAGRVYEYQLRLAVRYQLTVPGREEPVIAPTEIEARRLITYVESAPIAKEAEEQLLYKDMQVDLARQILRHIAAVKREM
jgi:LPS-assembly lipoprotein